MDFYWFFIQKERLTNDGWKKGGKKLKIYPKSLKIGYPLGEIDQYRDVDQVSGITKKTFFVFFFFSAEKDVKGWKEEKSPKRAKKGCRILTKLWNIENHQNGLSSTHALSLNVVYLDNFFESGLVQNISCKRP